MTKTGKLYGDSLYELALEKNVEQRTYSKELLDELRIVKSLFDENPDYIRLLQEPSIPRKTRLGLIDKAFGAQADEYLVNFLKLYGSISLCSLSNRLRTLPSSCRPSISTFKPPIRFGSVFVTNMISFFQTSSSFALSAAFC